jgi:integrase
MRGSKAETSPGVWRLRVFVGRRTNGSPIFRSKTVRTGDGKPGSGSRAADRELAKLVTEVANGTPAANAKGTVQDLLERWLEHCEAVDRSATTVREYRRIMDKVLIPEIGSIKLTKLSAQDLDRLYAKLTKKGNKATTVRRVHALIGAALHQAEKWDLAERNVSRRATPPPVRTSQVTAPTPDEVRKLIASAETVEPMMASVILMAALTGARRGELCGLRWSDFDGTTLTIERSVYETAGGGFEIKSTKTHQARRIGLDSLGVTTLERLRSDVEGQAKQLRLKVAKDAFMFSRSPQGLEPIRPDVLTKFIVRIAQMAKVDTHLHALRHFSATQAIAAGFDPVTVGGRLGHADASITLKVYGHVLEGRDQDAAAAIGATLALKAPQRT